MREERGTMPTRLNFLSVVWVNEKKILYWITRRDGREFNQKSLTHASKRSSLWKIVSCLIVCSIQILISNSLASSFVSHFSNIISLLLSNWHTIGIAIDKINLSDEKLNKYILKFAQILLQSNFVSRLYFLQFRLTLRPIYFEFVRITLQMVTSIFKKEVH